MAHSKNDGGESLMKLGKCRIPGCPCGRFRDSFQEIDEELV